MGVQRELDYLRYLQKRYGSHYVHRYFGFSFRQIAELIGVKRNFFSMVLSGQKKLPQQYHQKFIEVFNQLKVMEITKDYKETPAQLGIKNAYQELKKA